MILALVCGLALAFVGYTYAGYPILIVLWAKFRRRPIAKAPFSEWPTVSVVMCGHNEERRWDAKFATLAALDYPRDRLDVVVVDDGSTDGSMAELSRIAALPEWSGRVRIVAVAERTGKPNGLNRALEIATGDVIFMNDVRQRLNPEALRELVANFSDPKVGAAGGELVLEGAGGAGAYWKYEAAIRKQEGRVDSTLGVSGAIYVLRKELFQPIPIETILDDMRIPLSAHLRGYRIVFEPGARAYDTTADLKREFGRKVRTLAGNFQLLAAMPGLLVPWKNRSWFQLWSHKIFRLLVPYALAVILACSLIGIGELPYQLLLGGQALAYGAAAANALAKGQLPGPAGKIAGLCETFVTLNWAAVMGLWRFLTGQQRITW